LRRALIAVAPAFLLSRLLVFLGAEVIARRLPQEPNAVRYASDPLLSPLLRFDAQYYAAIMRLGYTGSAPGVPPPGYRIAFFPLYPSLARLLGDGYWSLVVLSNVAFFAAAVSVYLLGVRRFDHPVGAVAVWFLCFGPAAMFFSFPYTEPLFLLLSAAALLLAGVNRPVLGGFAGAAAAMTRGPGFLLAVPLSLQPGRRKLVALLPVLGLAAVALVSVLAVGDALGFLHAQAHWRGAPRSAFFPVGALVTAARLRDPFHPEALGLPVLVAFTLAAAWLAWRPSTRDLGLYSLALCALSAYQGYAVGGFQSVTRYLVVAFPCYFAFGVLFARRRAALVMALLVCAVYLTALSALFGSGHFIG
jgi:hypothetical protein